MPRPGEPGPISSVVQRGFATTLHDESRLFHRQGFIAKAEELFRLAARVKADPDLARDIDALAHEFMALAVTLDTQRDKARNETDLRRPSRRASKKRRV